MENVQLQTISGGVREIVAYYRQDKKPSYYEWKEGAIVWKGNITFTCNILSSLKESSV